jgi:hypothetical protein
MQMGAVTANPNSNVAQRLFRFVDLTAEPGKTYRYRIQLVVNNPNYGLKQDCLDPNAIQAKSFDNKFLMSKWSEPTAPVTIPQDVRMLADSVARGAEPKAKVNMLAVIKTPAYSDAGFGGGTPLTGKDVWLEVLKDYEWMLGSIPDPHEQVFQTFDNVTDISAGVVRRVEKPTIEIGQIMLADVRNDDPMGAPPPARPKTPPGPTEILYMDATGKLTAGSSAADRLVAKDYTERTTVPTEASSTPVVNPKPGKVPLPIPGPRGGAGGRGAG